MIAQLRFLPLTIPLLQFHSPLEFLKLFRRIVFESFLLAIMLELSKAEKSTFVLEHKTSHLGRFRTYSECRFDLAKRILFRSFFFLRFVVKFLQMSESRSYIRVVSSIQHSIRAKACECHIIPWRHSLR